MAGKKKMALPDNLFDDIQATGSNEYDEVISSEPEWSDDDNEDEILYPCEVWLEFPKLYFVSFEHVSFCSLFAKFKTKKESNLEGFYHNLREGQMTNFHMSCSL